MKNFSLQKKKSTRKINKYKGKESFDKNKKYMYIYI